MANPNTEPIYSKFGDIDGSPPITAAANDYTGQNINNIIVYNAEPTAGSFVQRLRFKALGTNIGTVARIYINNGGSPRAPLISAVAGTPTGTPSSSGGTLATASYFAKIYAVDQYGSTTAASTETASVSVTGPTGSITWNWTAVTGAVSYIISVGMATGVQQVKFTSTTNSYVQTAPGSISIEGDLTVNNYFFGEVSLLATTASATTATPDIDYIMNFAMPPGTNIVVGLGTAVSAGWTVMTIAGTYA